MYCDISVQAEDRDEAENHIHHLIDRLERMEKPFSIDVDGDTEMIDFLGGALDGSILDAIDVIG